MWLLAVPAKILSKVLAWLGRQGTRALAASVFIGIAVQPLAALFKPWITEQILVLLCLAFLRVDPARMRGYLAAPRLVVAATAWIMLAVPAALGTAFVLLGLDRTSPGLMLALVLQTVAPPLMSAPAFAALLGLDAALSLAALIACMVVTPFSSPVFAALFTGGAISVPPLTLGIKLALLLGGSSIAAMIIRRLLGQEAIARRREVIDGLNVVVLFIFAVALMDGVTAQIVSQPLKVAGYTLLAFAIAGGMLALTTLVFWRAGRVIALTVGVTVANRNMGLMLAATGGAVPELTWLYFALAQFPIYLLPQLLTPLARRVVPEKA